MLIRKSWLALLLVALPLASCGNTASDFQASHASRVKLYTGSKALTKDSALVIVGRVSGQMVSQDITPGFDFTLSTFTVGQVLKGRQVVEPGASVVVRQVGSSSQVPPTALMEPETDYLLYLTPSGLPAPLDAQYYVTGGNAGLYEGLTSNGLQANLVGGQDQLFKQVDATPGEPLPPEVNTSDATGS